MSIDNKLIYLNETKDKIKKAISVPIKDSDTFRSYPDKIKQMKDREEDLLVLGGVNKASAENNLIIKDGIDYVGNILKETEIEESGEKRQGYEVTLPQGLSKQEGSDSNNLYNYKDTVEVTSGYSTDEEGWITITYDNTQGSATRFLNYYTNNLNLKPSTNYNIIAEIKSVTGNGTLTLFSNYGDGGQMSTGDNNIFSSMTNNSIIQKTATTRESFENVILGLRSYVYFNAGQSGSITFRISVLEDTTITTENFIYKPFPPTIEYPSEIENVKAWNLIDVEQIAQQTQNVITTFDKKNGWLTIENPNSNMAYVNILVPIEHIIIGKTYSLKVEFKSEEGCNVYLQKSAEDYSNFTQGIDDIIKNTAIDTYMKVLITPIANQTVTVRLSLAEEQEKIENKTYAPYGAISIGLGNSNINDEIYELGGFTNDTGENVNQSDRFRIKNYIDIEKFQSVTIKSNVKSMINAVGRYGLFDKNKIQIENAQITSTNYTINTKNAKYLRFWFLNVSSENFDMNTAKIIVSSEATDYVEHQEQNYNLHLGDLELNGINNIRDSFVIELDNNYNYKKIKKLYLKKYYDVFVLNGVENWAKWASTPPSGYSVFYNASLKTTINKVELCDKLPVVDNGWSSGKNAISTQKTYGEIYISLETDYLQSNDTTGLKNFLSENPLKLLYSLKNPQLIDLTETYPQLVEDIENIINNISTYNNITYINTPTGYLEISYITKENDKYLELEEKAKYQNNKNILLEKNQIIKTAAGEDSLTINDSSNTYANIIDSENNLLLPQGLSRQEQREGYNLLNIENYTDNTKLITSISDEKIVATTKLSSEYSYEQVIFLNNIELKTGITYTLRRVMKIISGTARAVSGQVELYVGDTWKKVIGVGSASGYDSKNTFTVEEDNTYRLRIKLANADDVTEVFSVEFTNLMIYEGSEDKSYEQYGATPSIEIPSEIENVKAYNLFDKDTVINNKYIDATGNENINDQWVITDYMEVDSNSNYTYFGITGPGASPYSAFYDSNKTFISSFKQKTNKNIIEVPKNAKYVRFSISKGVSNDLNTFIFYKGTEYKPYAPYGAISIDLENKNLLNLGEKRSIDNLGITTSIISNTKIKLNGTTTSAGNIFNGLTYNTEYIRLPILKKGTYKFSSIFDGNIIAVDNSYAIYLRDDTGAQLGFRTNNLNTDFTFTLNEATNLYLQVYTNKAGVTFNGILSLQIEEGEIATSYIEHQEQNYNLHIKDLELNGIRDIRDSFIVEVDNSYSYKKVKKLYYSKKYIEKVFTGEANSDNRILSKHPSIYSETKGLFQIKLENKKKSISSILAKECMKSNYLKVVDNNGAQNSFNKYAEGLWNEGKTIFAYLILPFTTLADANNWLQELNTQGNPLKILYPLETPELIDLTETYPELVQDIENIINNMFTYEEVTHIDTPIGYLEINYNQSINSLINEYENRISALESAVLGE